MGSEKKHSSSRELVVYFDTPELLLLKNSGYLSYSAKEYMSKKDKLKYDEEIEFNYKNKKLIVPVKHYKNSKTLEGKHPLMSLVKRKYREVLTDELKNSEINQPMRIKPIFNVSKIVDSYKIVSDSNETLTLESHTIFSNSFDNELNFTLYYISSESNEKNEYSVYYDYFDEKVDFLSLRLNYPELVNLAYVFFLGLIAMATVFILFRNRLRKSN